MTWARAGSGRGRQVANRRGSAVEEYYRRGVDTYVRVVGPDDPSVSFALNNLASALAELDRADEALQAARRAHQICSTAMGDDYWVTH